MPQTPAADSVFRTPRVSSYCYKNFFNFSRKYHENTLRTILRVLDYCQIETSEIYVFYNEKSSKPNS